MCTIRYMPRPVTVTIDVPQDRARVYDFLDVMANHEPFTNHLMTDWQLSGPSRGVGSKAQVRVRSFGVNDVIDIEVLEAHPFERIVERNVARKAGRVGQGTYLLTSRDDGGTTITFEYRWINAPVFDRMLSPLTRAYLRHVNNVAMRRLAAQLSTTNPGHGPGGHGSS